MASERRLSVTARAPDDRRCYLNHAVIDVATDGRAIVVIDGDPLLLYESLEAFLAANDLTADDLTLESPESGIKPKDV